MIAPLIFAAKVHTTGVNWQLYSAIVGTIGPLLTSLVWILRHEIRGWTSKLTGRIDKQDAVIKEIQDDAKVAATISAATNVSVARIEGALAATYGGGTRLPTPAQTSRNVAIDEARDAVDAANGD